MEAIKKPRVRFRTWLANLPPVDWDALAMRYLARRERWTRKGDKRPLADVEKVMASRRRNKLAKRNMALKRAIEARKFRKPVPVFTMRLRVLHAMRPGAPHTRHEIQTAAGLTKNETHWKLHNLRRDGLVERHDNPDHRRVHVALETPRYLFRLTAAGEAEREATSWMV